MNSLKWEYHPPKPKQRDCSWLNAIGCGWDSFTGAVGNTARWVGEHPFSALYNTSCAVTLGATCVTGWAVDKVSGGKVSETLNWADKHPGETLTYSAEGAVCAFAFWKCLAGMGAYTGAKLVSNFFDNRGVSLEGWSPGEMLNAGSGGNLITAFGGQGPYGGMNSAVTGAFMDFLNQKLKNPNEPVDGAHAACAAVGAGVISQVRESQDNRTNFVWGVFTALTSDAGCTNK
jgi:hypothetical protein